MRDIWIYILLWCVDKVVMLGLFILSKKFGGNNHGNYKRKNIRTEGKPKKP